MAFCVYACNDATKKKKNENLIMRTQVLNIIYRNISESDDEIFDGIPIHIATKYEQVRKTHFVRELNSRFQNVF